MAAERHPFQFIPETAIDDPSGSASPGDQPAEPEPMLRQAVTEVAGKWRTRAARLHSRTIDEDLPPAE